MVSQAQPGTGTEKYPRILSAMSDNTPDKILVILDLDETLVHATDTPHDDQWHFEVFGYKVYRRPYLTEFLEGLREDFHVAVWSSASDDYVKAVTANIFPPDYDLKFTWGRSRCTHTPDYSRAEREGTFGSFAHYDYVKPLDKLRKKFPFKRERMLIIDDTPRKSMHNYGNAIYPSEFKGQHDDDELMFLLRYLQRLKDLDDVRKREKRGWRNEF
jgi:RNA polymerase II subunit A small phosphatase-like protein